jgi:hypothetical protein
LRFSAFLRLKDLSQKILQTKVKTIQEKVIESAYLSAYQQDTLSGLFFKSNIG